MQYTDHAKLKTATVVSDLLYFSALVVFLKCIKDTLNCGRLCNSFNRWFSEKRKKAIPFSYRFTGLESKRFSWNFAHLFQGLLQIEKLSSGSILKLHTLAFTSVQIRDAVAIYSRVKLSKQQFEELRRLRLSLLLLRKMDPYSISYRQENYKECDSYIPKRVKAKDTKFCYCGLPKQSVTDEGCMVCTGNVIKLVKQSVPAGKVTTELQQFVK